MPGTARARNKRPRARFPAKRPPDPITELAKQMHLPMNEAIAYMQALVLVGHGMAELGREDACVVLTIARAAGERLEIINETFGDLLQIARR